jgi:beta-glucosidase
MKYIKKILKYLLLSAGALILIISISAGNLELAGIEAPVLTIDNHSYRDLNKNGKVDVYEDPRKPREERVSDLLGQMTLEERRG